MVGYVDTIGFDVDATNIIVSENKWRYRDYVIAAWNQDKPFDRFLEEQIAGDEIVDWRRAEHYTPEIKDCLTATGFLRMAPTKPTSRKATSRSVISLSYTTRWRSSVAVCWA